MANNQMSVWRSLLVTIFPWAFKGAIAAAKAAVNKQDVGAVLSQTVDDASNDPNVVAAENAAIDATISKVGKK